MEARVCCVSGKSGDIGKYRGNTYAIYHRSDGFLPSVILEADHQLCIMMAVHWIPKEKEGYLRLWSMQK